MKYDQGHAPIGTLPAVTQSPSLQPRRQEPDRAVIAATTIKTCIDAPPESRKAPTGPFRLLGLGSISFRVHVCEIMTGASQALRRRSVRYFEPYRLRIEAADMNCLRVGFALLRGACNENDGNALLPSPAAAWHCLKQILHIFYRWNRNSKNIRVTIGMGGKVHGDGTAPWRKAVSLRPVHDHRR
jgi:hypothetical protein